MTIDKTNSFETIRLGPRSVETTFISDYTHLKSYSFYAALKKSWFDLL